MKKIAILQSNYIPWKGYFDLINAVDEFILYDEAQFTRRDWRNRNCIPTKDGLKWLTIPVEVKGRFTQKIRETKVVDESWGKKHWKTLAQNYAKAPFFKEFEGLLEDLFLNTPDGLLSEINYKFLKALCEILGIRTKLSWSHDFGYARDSGKTGKLILLCQETGADMYVSGPAAKDYMEEDLFRKAGIRLAYANYSGYPAYHQPHGPFEHHVSVLDLLFNEGPNAKRYMKTFESDKSAFLDERIFTN